MIELDYKSKAFRCEYHDRTNVYVDSMFLFEQHAITYQRIHGSGVTISTTGLALPYYLLLFATFSAWSYYSLTERNDRKKITSMSFYSCHFFLSYFRDHRKTTAENDSEKRQALINYLIIINHASCTRHARMMLECIEGLKNMNLLA